MVVQAEMGGLRPDRYRHVDVSIPSKSFRSSGYVHVPGYDMSTFAALGPASRGEPPSPAPTASARGPAAPGGGTVGISIGSITTNSGRVPVTYGDYVEGSKHDSGRSDG
jgi:hypothetical protein